MGFDSLLGVARFLTSSSNEKINILNKGISECGKIYLADYFANTYSLCTVISGTAQFVRNMVLEAQTQCAVTAGLPVVIIHSQNTQLAYDLQRLNCQIPVSIVDSTSGNFSPFLGLDEYEAIDIILDSIPGKYDVKQNARYYLEAVSDLMKANKISTSFNNYLTCPHNTLLDRIDRSVYAGKISDSNAQNMRSKIMIGQSEHFKLDSFLHGLSKQMGAATHNKKASTPPVSIYKTIRSGGIISIDVGPTFNSIYLDFLVEQLKLANNKGIPFMLALDSISINENRKLKEIINVNSSTMRRIVSCDDLLSSCGGNNDLFSSIVASSKQYMIFSHTSATSAEKWASVLGEYERIDENISKSRSRADDGMGFWSMNPNNNVQKTRTVNTSKRRDYVVPPEKIVSMQNNELYIRSEAFQGIKHGYIIN